MRVGLFGGSFNPIHNAHIALASTIRKEARLDEVWFMVSPQNPLKQEYKKAKEELDFAREIVENERYEMVELALESREKELKASNYEFHLERPSFTWKTLRALKKDFPQHEFSLIIGGDNWKAFPRWANNEEILANHHIYIYPREDSEIDEATLPENVHLIHTPKINITSTMLREMVRNGKDISAFVPNAVAKAIADNNLYAE